MSRNNTISGGPKIHHRPSYQLIITVLSGLAAAVLFFLLLFLTDWHPYLAWLLAASLTTFALFGIDKGLAKAGKYRIPENVLHLFTLLGGFFGQLASRLIFHHKTNFRRHPSFTIVAIAGIVIWAIIGYLLFF